MLLDSLAFISSSPVLPSVLFHHTGYLLEKDGAPMPSISSYLPSHHVKSARVLDRLEGSFSSMEELGIPGNI